MANKRVAMTDEERAERRKQEQQLTEQAVAQLRCSAGWQRWLTVRARVGLRRYSVRNQLLIALQDPRATHVAGFRAWLRPGVLRQARRELAHPRVGAVPAVEEEAGRPGAPPARSRRIARGRTSDSRRCSAQRRSSRCRRRPSRRRWIRRSPK